MSTNDTLGVALRDVRGLLKDTMDKLDSSPKFREQLRLLLRDELSSQSFCSKGDLEQIRAAIRAHLAREKMGNPVCTVEADSFAYSALWERWHEQLNWTSDSTMMSVEIGSVAARPTCVLLRFVKINGHCVCFYDATSMLVDHEMVRKFREAMFPGVPGSDASNFHNVRSVISTKA